MAARRPWEEVSLLRKPKAEFDHPAAGSGSLFGHDSTRRIGASHSSALSCRLRLTLVQAMLSCLCTYYLTTGHDLMAVHTFPNICPTLSQSAIFTPPASTDDYI